MYDISIFHSVLWTVLFALASLFALYIPGSVALRSYRLRPTLHIPLSLTVGIALFGLQGFLFGYLSMRFLTYVYLATMAIIWMRQGEFSSVRSHLIQVRHAFFSNKWLLGIITVGVMIQMTTIAFTMIPTSKGLFFCCGDVNDNTWFASITAELIRTIPPQQPGMEGVLLKNYHFLSNLVVADISRVFSLPFLLVQYQYFPLLLSVLYGLLAVTLGRLLRLSNRFVGWLLFFLYFGSDAIFATILVLGRGINFSMSSLEDGVRFLANLPRVYAIVVAFGFLNLFLLWLHKKETYRAILLGVVAASLIGFKVYVGIFVFVGLGVVALYDLITGKGGQLWWAIIVGLLVGVGIYLPVNAGAGGLYFTGLWRFENFAVQPALGLLSVEQARVIYTEHRNWARMMMYEGFYIVLYMFATFGSKLVGLIQTKHAMKYFPLRFHIFLISGMLVSLVAGLFFNQTVGTSNTFNFLVSVFIFLSLYSALTMSYVTAQWPRFVRNIFVICILFITLPRIGNETVRNITNIANGNAIRVRQSAVLASQFVQAHSTSTDSVLVDTRDFYYDVDAPMFSILLNKPTYLSGMGLLRHFGEDIRGREKIVSQIFAQPDPVVVAMALEESGVDYLISSFQTPPTSTVSAVFLPVVYENAEVVVRKVDGALVEEIVREAKDLQ